MTLILGSALLLLVFGMAIKLRQTNGELDRVRQRYLAENGARNAAEHRAAALKKELDHTVRLWTGVDGAERDRVVLAVRTEDAETERRAQEAAERQRGLTSAPKARATSYRTSDAAPYVDTGTYFSPAYDSSSSCDAGGSFGGCD